IAVVRALQLASDPLQAGWQQPVLEGGAIAQRTGFAGKHRHVMPGIVDRLAAPEAAAMLADDRTVLTDHKAIGAGLDLDRPADGARGDRVLVVVEAHQAVFETDAWIALKPSNGPPIGTSCERSASKACQIVW